MFEISLYDEENCSHVTVREYNGLPITEDSLPFALLYYVLYKKCFITSIRLNDTSLNKRVIQFLLEKENISSHDITSLLRKYYRILPWSYRKKIYRSDSKDNARRFIRLNRELYTPPLFIDEHDKDGWVVYLNNKG